MLLVNHCSLCSHSKNLRHEFYLRQNVPSFDTLNLSFSDHVHRFIAPQCSSGCVERAIGGNAFAHAFSFFLQMHGASQYHVLSNKMVGRAHPVTWIRVHLLADRMRKMQQFEAAKSLEDDWSAIAHSMEVVEDYYGFYEPEFLPFIQQMIDDMLTEAEPYNLADKTPINSLSESVVSPPQLLNQAWLVFLQSPETFPNWERKAIVAFTNETRDTAIL